MRGNRPHRLRPAPFPSATAAAPLLLAERESGQRKPQAEVADILPPVVRILSPEESSEAKEDEITVRFQVRSPPGAAVTEIKALVDGRPRATEHHLNLTAPEFEREIRVPLPERDSDVGIIAKNHHAWSEAAKVRVRWAGSSAVDLPPRIPCPGERSYLLIESSCTCITSSGMSPRISSTFASSSSP